MNNQDIPKSGCCDGECNHDDCCGKIPENCTHSPKESEEWEARFDEEFPPGSYWDDYAEPSEIKSFIKELIAKTREEERKLLREIVEQKREMFLTMKKSAISSNDSTAAIRFTAKEQVLKDILEDFAALDKETK